MGKGIFSSVFGRLSDRFKREGTASSKPSKHRIKSLKNRVNLNPRDILARRTLGDIFLKQGNHIAAVEQFERIAQNYEEENYVPKAIAMYQRIVKIAPGYKSAGIKLVELHLKQQNFHEARRLCLDLVAKEFSANNIDKAAELYCKILEFDEENTGIRVELAHTYWKMGEEKRAIKEYLTAVDVLLELEEFERVEELLTGILAKTTAPGVYKKLFLCYSIQHKIHEAFEIIEDENIRLSDDFGFLKAATLLFLEMGLLEEAVKLFWRAQEINPGDIELVTRMGEIYLESDVDTAYEFLLPHIDYSMEEGRGDDASLLLRLIINKYNDYLPALEKLCELYEKTGKTANLIALYDSLTYIYNEKGMNDRLEELLKKLIELSADPLSYEDQLEQLTGKPVKRKRAPVIAEQAPIEEDEAVESGREKTTEFEVDLSYPVYTPPASGEMEVEIDMEVLPANDFSDVDVEGVVEDLDIGMDAVEPHPLEFDSLEESGGELYPEVSPFDTAELAAILPSIEEGMPPVETGGKDRRKKSFSRQNTLSAPSGDRAELLKVLETLAAKLAWELGKEGLQSGKIALKIKHLEDKKNTSRSMTPKEPVSDAGLILAAAKGLLAAVHKSKKARQKKVKMLCISLSNLVPRPMGEEIK